MEPFDKLSVPLLNSYKFNLGRSTVATKKYEVIRAVLDENNAEPESILYVGFCPSMFNFTDKKVFVSDITPEVAKYIATQAPHIVVTEIGVLPKVDCVIAMNEYLTFASTEAEQQSRLGILRASTNGLLITSVRDYKSLTNKNFSDPVAVHNDKDSLLFLEFHKHSLNNVWSSTVTQIEEPGVLIEHFGPFARTPLYFKRLARLSYEIGAKKFLVHKNQMYKGLIRQNYEHVVSVVFG